MISESHEKNVGLPAPTLSSASANLAIGASRSASDAAPLETPCNKVDSVVIRPRNDGSAAIGPKNGSALIRRAMSVCTSLSGR